MLDPDTRHLQMLDTFGDASEVLSALAPDGTRDDGGSAVVAVGAFRVPARAGFWRYRTLRRKARTQTLRSVAQMAPVAAVIALEAAHIGNVSKARALGTRLAKDLPYVSSIRFGHHLPTVVVLIRGYEGRQRLVTNLRRGLFHHSDAYGGVVIDAADLPQPQALPESRPLLPAGLAQDR